MDSSSSEVTSSRSKAVSFSESYDEVIYDLARKRKVMKILSSTLVVKVKHCHQMMMMIRDGGASNESCLRIFKIDSKKS